MNPYPSPISASNHLGCSGLPNLALAKSLGNFAVSAGLLLTTASTPAQAVADGPRPGEFSAPIASTFQLRLLPGQREFVFSMYGAPGELELLKQLVGVMREQKLGNGFDPGPGPHPNSKPVFDYLAAVGWPVICYSGGEMQIKGGRAVFGPEHEAALAAMDRAGVFTAIQLGEWGYYFHNLAPNEPWWRDVYGKEFDAFKHLMKPAGLAGYDRRPANKQACFDVVKDYYTSRSRDLLHRVISVTGHSHYEAYVGGWGARCIGLELGENIAFTQSKLAFARGASRQWQKPWSVQVSPWFHGACTTSGPLRKEGRDARGLEAGHSLSFYERLWLHAWFAGAAMVTPENSIAIFFEKAEPPWTLTTHGRKAAEVFQFMRSHERGVPFTPVAIVLDQLAGYNGYMDKPWGILAPTAGDRQVRDLFDHQLFPSSDHIHTNPFPANPEFSYLRPTPYGEIFDVQLSSASAEMLASYPVILLAGDIVFDEDLIAKLERALKQGRKLLLAPAHQAALGARFARLTKYSGVEVLPPWKKPATGRPAAISDARLQELARETLPVEVAGDPIQYQINRTTNGWVIELINNAGVIKKPNEPAITDPNAIAHVILRPKFRCASAREWRSNQVYSPAEEIRLAVGPGQSAFVELRETNLAGQDTPGDEAGFVSLFNGKDLTGWSGSGWTVEDGVMVCHGGNLAYTHRVFTNFVLRFEVKLSPGGNNGLNFRTEGSIWNEIQILDDAHPLFKDIHPYQAHGSIYGVVPAKRGFLKPAGEWNAEEVTADGSHIKVRLNGEVIVDADLSKLDLDKCIDGNAHPGLRRTSGGLAWLGHLNAQEQVGPVYFRNIRIKTLP